MKSNHVTNELALLNRSNLRLKRLRVHFWSKQASLILAILALSNWGLTYVNGQTSGNTPPNSFTESALVRPSAVNYPSYPSQRARAAVSAARREGIPSNYQLTKPVVPTAVPKIAAAQYGTRVESADRSAVALTSAQVPVRNSVPTYGAIEPTGEFLRQAPATPLNDQSLVAPVSMAPYAQQAVSPVETLDHAIRIALAESRSQRALALKNGAARSNVQAARSLANPKISNATSYVGLLNQPATVSEIDLSKAAKGMETLFPELAPVIAQFPTEYQIQTPLCDKDFVTSVTAVSLPIYLGGRVAALTREAEALAQAAEAGKDVGEQLVKFEVSEAYFLVLRTRQLRQVAAEAVRTAQSHQADAERMFNVGLLTRNVVLAAQVATSEAQQTELKVLNAQQLAEAAYNRLMWRPLDAPVALAEVELPALSGDLELLTAEAVRSRKELQSLAAQSRALQAQEKVARADVLPQVAAVGAYSYFENSHLNENSNATAAVAMTWTPVDGGTSRARQNAARQNAMAMARLRDEAESGIRLQVRQAWLAEQEARQRVEVAKAAVEQAEENLRVVTRGFQEGTVNHTETLDAATMRTTAKSNYTNAQYDAILAAQRLRFAVGVL